MFEKQEKAVAAWFSGLEKEMVGADLLRLRNILRGKGCFGAADKVGEAYETALVELDDPDRKTKVESYRQNKKART